MDRRGILIGAVVFVMGFMAGQFDLLLGRALGVNLRLPQLTDSFSIGSPSFPKAEKGQEASAAVVHTPAPFDFTEIVNTNIWGAPGRFFNQTRKCVSCDHVWGEQLRSRPRQEPPPKWEDVVPELQRLFSYNGTIKVKSDPRSLYDNRYLGHKAMAPDWSESVINAAVRDCSRGKLRGTYGHETTRKLFKALQSSADVVRGKSVLVIGSENPWVEACCLAAGAANVTTLEYGAINTSHPLLRTLTPDTARELYIQHSPDFVFDVVVTYSSLEHSGLGRYGDILDPHGDIKSVARAWCLVRDGGAIFAGVPCAPKGSDEGIEWNAHKFYGKVMLPHLLANWEQINIFEANWFTGNIVYARKLPPVPYRPQPSPR
eukprot:CAMPEP_0173424574 /NCGR_PEP_ID=MMETSP1357-20121228/4459_1 /TAXON_ID=77926 /ORGANISM="Hemiselmis rufescens, Strain PCC563" /LENGTH=372 /DNA_ID=CAMNT_0014387829 /DNA_START=143 /DNA_END=1261 /DNA_ORIENTATION=+